MSDQEKNIHKLVLGGSAEENAVVLDAFKQQGYPIRVGISNLMPRNIALPEFTSNVLLHVAAPVEKTRATGTLTDHAALVRMAGNVQAICELSGYANGISIEAEFKEKADEAVAAPAAAPAQAAPVQDASASTEQTQQAADQAPAAAADAAPKAVKGKK